MEILRGDKGNIDFSSPIHLTRVQRERLINFLKQMFYHVEIKETTFFRSERLGADNPFNKEWEPEEFELLLKLDENNLEVSRKLGRTWMSIEMKRIIFIPEMMNYALKNGVNIYQTDIRKLVKDYLKEHEAEILKRKEERKKERQEEKKSLLEIKELEEQIIKLDKLAGIPGFPTRDQVEEKKNKLKKLKLDIKYK